jgi:proteasome alpha subunit
MQFYASPEQINRDRSEYARKGIARGRSAIVLTYEHGILFVAENMTALHKVSEIYDRIGFAAVGRYNEFENLRAAGIRLADLRGYSYARKDVTGRALANAYAQTLGAIFTEQTKPFEVEICVAEVGDSGVRDELYRITYDGSIQDEPGVVVMGGQAEAISGGLRAAHRAEAPLGEALHLAVQALGSVGGEGGQPRTLAANQLEVAVLDRRRAGRTFRRIAGNALTTLLQSPAVESVELPAEDTPAAEPAAEATEPAGTRAAEPARVETAEPAGQAAEPAGAETAASQAPAAPDQPAGTESATAAERAPEDGRSGE